MWHFLRVPNIGDLVGPDIVSHISGRDTIFFADPSQSRLFSIGSILGSADPKSIVWGSGLMDPDQQVSIVGSNIYALRGKLTHQQLRAAGVAVPDVPLGDPGFLIPELMPPVRAERKFRLGIIPHYADRQHPLVERLVREDGVVDINVHAPAAEFFRSLQSCDAVVSSSLHGLIFAEAFGIPNLWIKLSDRVVRTGFKFHDWFSLADQPQHDPYEPRGDDTVAELASRAILHDVRLDGEGLAAGFPEERLEELSQNLGNRRYVALSKCREMPLPVFVISYNRGAFLRRAVDSYRKMSRKVTIIVHDNGSDDPATLRVLEELRSEGCLVFHSPPITHPDELNSVNDTVQHYFETWAEPSRYVVTDCDIDLTIADSAALDVYDELLNRYTAVQCVGPMIRIRDIPESYPLFRSAMTRHIAQFWHRKPEWIETTHGRVATIDCPIDTTFALHRAGEPFVRMKSSRRVYYPYEAQHLDWYVPSTEYSSSSYFNTSAADISHWNNVQAHRLLENEPLEFEQFTYVDTNAEERLVERTQILARPSNFRK